MPACQRITAEDGQQRHECSHDNQHCLSLTNDRRGDRR
ncbi:hypothetical protein C7S15_0449 [Burkholderia cepacia]|nr:hypothetical protein [Burkholderia cepacia]